MQCILERRLYVMFSKKIFYIIWKIIKYATLCAIGCCNKSYRKTKDQIDVEENVEITFHR